jgi:hypothetical protein
VETSPEVCNKEVLPNNFGKYSLVFLKLSLGNVYEMRNQK